MPLLDPAFAVRHVRNAAATPGAPYGPRQRAVLNRDGFERAWREIRAWPGYEPTPMHDLSGLAAAAGVSRIRYKDEGPRFGLGSFKALGGAYAVFRLLAGEVERATGAAEVTAADILAGKYRDVTQGITVCCATDGNHGRSVAWGARQFGCNCVIYIHEGVSRGRQQAIESFGARVVRCEGNYDDSVRRADAEAAANGWTVVSDTSYEGYMEIPRDVMQGYTVMAEEAIRQLADEPAPTHIFIPGGVGGFAAAVCAQYWEAMGADRPRLVVVEPENAACLFASAEAGTPTPVHGELETIMAGLSCGEISLLAWEILEEGVDDFLTIPDGAAAACMRLLADGVGGDAPIVAGESAVAGLAGALLALARPDLAEALDLGPESRLLFFGSEGATDAEVYTSLVGRRPEEVVAG